MFSLAHTDAEPRRSVRTTKGQHKALEPVEPQPNEPRKRGRRAKKNGEKDDDDEEEVIRCVCGATEQGGDSVEPWIACDRCGAWQHNVCMGMSRFREDLLKEYFCELCKPEDHTALLEGVARGEKPWEERRLAYERDLKGDDKKKKGGRKPKGKRNSDGKDDPSQQGSQKSQNSPPPEPKKETRSASTPAAAAGAAATGPAAAGTKRKPGAASDDKGNKVSGVFLCLPMVSGKVVA